MVSHKNSIETDLAFSVAIFCLVYQHYPIVLKSFCLYIKNRLIFLSMFYSPQSSLNLSLKKPYNLSMGISTRIRSHMSVCLPKMGQLRRAFPLANRLVLHFDRLVELRVQCMGSQHGHFQTFFTESSRRSKPRTPIISRITTSYGLIPEISLRFHRWLPCRVCN